MTRMKLRAPPRGKYLVRYLAHYSKKHRTMLLLGALLLFGVALGTAVVRSTGDETIELILRLIGGAAEKRRGAPFTQCLVKALWSSTGFCVAAFLCGFCAVARPAIAAIPFLRGLGFGFSAASLYVCYGASAAGFVSLFMLPGMVVSGVALLFCASEALQLSGCLWKLLMQHEATPYPLRIYCARFIAASALCVLAAALEAACYTFFPNAFLLG